MLSVRHFEPLVALEHPLNCAYFSSFAATTELVQALQSSLFITVITFCAVVDSWASEPFLSLRC